MRQFPQRKHWDRFGGMEKKPDEENPTGIERVRRDEIWE
jgi:hypothetical protein